MADSVIVLHGLWMRGLALSALTYRLNGAGLGTESFDFMSVKSPVATTLERLRQAMRGQQGRVHLVGHSLGGLMALEACRGRSDLPPGRIVCLGSPLRGSAAARQLGHWGAGALMGHSLDLLENGVAEWDRSREVGVVAGTLPIGLGAVLGAPGDDHDGTVAVAETRLPGLADHCCVAASHTGLLFSAAAAGQAEHFLRTGRFRPD